MERFINTNRILSFQKATDETKYNKEFLNIGPTPHNEDCTQVGQNFSDNIFECGVYIRQLKRVYGPPPEGCEFFIMQNLHDFGTYYDANIFYTVPVEDDDDSPSSTHVYEHTPKEELLRQNEEYALKMESGLDYWDEEAKQELIEGEHHLHIARVVNFKKSA